MRSWLHQVSLSRCRMQRRWRPGCSCQAACPNRSRLSHKPCNFRTSCMDFLHRPVPCQAQAVGVLLESSLLRGILPKNSADCVPDCGCFLVQCSNVFCQHLVLTVRHGSVRAMKVRCVQSLLRKSRVQIVWSQHTWAEKSLQELHANTQPTEALLSCSRPNPNGRFKAKLGKRGRPAKTYT